MRRSFGIIALALVLAVAGGASLFAGRFERRMAIAQEDMAVLDFADPQQEYVRLQQDLAKLPWTSRVAASVLAGRLSEPRRNCESASGSRRRE